MVKFSPGKLYKWQCPKRVWLEKHGVHGRRPANSAELSLGTIVHTVISRSLKSRKPLQLMALLDDFAISWEESSRFLKRADVIKLGELGRKCIMHFYHLYGEGDRAKYVLDSEVLVSTKISNDGSLASSRGWSGGFSLYALEGRVDVIEKPKSGEIILTDFKVDFKQCRLPLYRLQFGVYSLCLSLLAGARQICCQVVDLSGGQIVPIAPLPSEKLHRIILSTLGRMEADPMQKNTRFCWDCPFQNSCDEAKELDQLELELAS